MIDLVRRLLLTPLLYALSSVSSGRMVLGIAYIISLLFGVLIRESGQYWDASSDLIAYMDCFHEQVRERKGGGSARRDSPHRFLSSSLVSRSASWRSSRRRTCGWRMLLEAQRVTKRSQTGTRLLSGSRFF